MIRFRTLRIALIALPLLAATTLAAAGEWEYYEDSDGSRFYSERYSDAYVSPPVPSSLEAF